MNIYLGARWSETDCAALTLAAADDTVWFAENAAAPTTNDQAALATAEIVIEAYAMADVDDVDPDEFGSELTEAPGRPTVPTTSRSGQGNSLTIVGKGTF